jgi:hypothetical protein
MSSQESVQVTAVGENKPAASSNDNTSLNLCALFGSPPLLEGEDLAASTDYSLASPRCDETRQPQAPSRLSKTESCCWDMPRDLACDETGRPDSAESALKIIGVMK